MKGVDSLAFPNINFALKLLGALSVTTCECKRSFSCFQTVKIWDRSTMANAMLNGLALLFIHREIDLDVSEIIDLSMQKNIRIQLKYLSKMRFFKKKSLQK